LYHDALFTAYNDVEGFPLHPPGQPLQCTADCTSEPQKLLADRIGAKPDLFTAGTYAGYGGIQ
ncbi:hypothetical protein AMQ83_06895, partial [Paenibacillus riograndensis]